MKLAAKVILVFLLLVMGLTAIQGVLAIQRERVFFRRQHENAAARFTSAVEDRLRSAAPSLEQIEAILATGGAGDLAVRVRWVTIDTTASYKEHWQLADPDIQRGEMISFETRSGGVGTLHTYYALESFPQGHRGLEFSTPLEPLEQRNWETLADTLSLLAAMSCVSVIVIVMAGVRIIGRPLEKLIEKTRRIGEGDLSEPLHLERRDELGQLATALNEMCDKLNAQQQQLEQETAARLATMDQLRHADRLKTVGRLAAGLAHEMGTPLNVVSGRAGLIASGKLTADEVRDSAATIRSECDRIARVIRQLLDFARRNTAQRSRVDLRDLVSQTAHLLEGLAAKQAASLTVSADPHTDFEARIDAGQIQQAVTNLIVNAIQAMPDGGRIEIRLRRERARRPEAAAPEPPVAEPLVAEPPVAEPPIAEPLEVFSIEVCDAGTGIAPEDLEHIFEPFFTTKDVGQGTGLGLSIVHGIAEEHGGWIDVRSEVGSGTCFTLRIPAAHARNGESAREGDPTQSGEE